MASQSPLAGRPNRKAHMLFQNGLISRVELDSLLRADARFRFEEVVPPQKAASVEAATPAAPPPPLSHAGASMPPAPSRIAIQAQRDAARRRGREQKKAQVRAAEREAQMQVDAATWEKVLAEWDGKRQGLRTKGKTLAPLCARGIPPSVRKRAWSALIDNPLQITKELYDITLQRARATSELQKADSAMVAERAAADSGAAGAAAVGASAGPAAALGKEDTMAYLDQDLPRSFPGELAAVQQESETLREVLQAFVCFRPDIGYVQGMSYLAAALLLYYSDGFECFTCFANLLNSHFFFDFYRLKRDKIDVHLECFEHYFRARLPVLFHHFKREDVTPEHYYLEWSLTLFVKFVPLNICARIWDSYLLHGEAYFMRVALGLLRCYAETLASMEMEGILRFLQRLPPDIDEAALFRNIDDISITPESCERTIRRIEETGSSKPAASALESCSPS